MSCGSLACPPAPATLRMKSDKSGRRTIFHSFRDAFRGVWACIKSERNMRVHLSVCCYVVFFGFRMGLSRGELCCLFLTIGLVTAMETMNTAVERLCDFTENRLNPHIRAVKDLAAGGVVLAAIAAVAVGAALFLRPAMWEAITSLCAQPLSVALLLLSVILALVFIFYGPEKLAALFKKTR